MLSVVCYPCAEKVLGFDSYGRLVLCIVLGCFIVNWIYSDEIILCQYFCFITLLFYDSTKKYIRNFYIALYVTVDIFILPFEFGKFLYKWRNYTKVIGIKVTSCERSNQPHATNATTRSMRLHLVNQLTPKKKYCTPIPKSQSAILLENKRIV